MKSALFLLAAIVALLSVASIPTQLFAQGAEPVLTGCMVKLQDDIKLPAKEAGVLVYLGVQEGDQVREGSDVGRVDDSEARMQKKVAQYAHEAAVKKSEDDVEIRYQQAAAEVAWVQLIPSAECQTSFL